MAYEDSWGGARNIFGIVGAGKGLIPWRSEARMHHWCQFECMSKTKEVTTTRSLVVVSHESCQECINCVYTDRTEFGKRHSPHEVQVCQNKRCSMHWNRVRQCHIWGGSHKAVIHPCTLRVESFLLLSPNCHALKRQLFELWMQNGLHTTLSIVRPLWASELKSISN